MGPLAIPEKAVEALGRAAGLRRKGKVLFAVIGELLALSYIQEANPEWWPTVEA